MTGGKTLADWEIDGHIQKFLRLNLVLGSLEVKGDEALEFPRIRDNLPPLILALPPLNLESLAGKAEIGIFPHTPAFTGKSKDIAFQRLFKNRGKREVMSREIGDDFGQFRVFALISGQGLIKKEVALVSEEIEEWD